MTTAELVALTLHKAVQAYHYQTTQSQKHLLYAKKLVFAWEEHFLYYKVRPVFESALSLFLKDKFLYFH